MARSNEAFWWSLFSAGGILAALFLPAFITITGVILPFEDDFSQARYESLHQVLSSWPARLLLLGVICTTFFHCAHRIRHTAMDLGLRSADKFLKALCYGGALVVTIATAFIVASI